MEAMRSLEDSNLNRPYKNDKTRGFGIGSDLHLNLDIIEFKKEKVRKAKLVQLAKTNRKPGRVWVIYLSTFAVYLTAVLAALIISQSLISNYSSTSNELFKITMIYNDCNYHITNSATSFLDYKSVSYSGAILTAADYAMINRSFFTDDFYAFKQKSMAADHSELSQKINNISDHLINSKPLIELGYSKHEFSRSYNWLYNISENWISPNDTERKSYINLNLITLQSISMYWNILGNEINLLALTDGPLVRELPEFIIEKGLGDTMEKLHVQVSNSRNRFARLASDFNLDFYSTIGTTTGVVALIFGLWIAALCFHRATIADILQTYCVLNYETLEVELNRIYSIEKAVFLNTFNAKENMKYARSSLNDLIPEQKNTWNNGGGTQYHDNQSFNSKIKGSTKTIMTRGREKQYFSHTSKFTYGPPIKVFWYSFLTILILIFIWGIEAIMLFKIGHIIKENNTIKEMAMINVEYCMKLRVDFSKYFRLSPYTVLFLDAKQMEDTYNKLSYAEDHEQYLEWWTENQGILIETFGRATTFEKLQNADLCTLELESENADEHAYQYAWPENVKISCETALNGALKKGYFQYSIYEANMMKTVKRKLEPIIKDINSIDRLTLLSRLQDVWFAPDFVQLRSWHQHVYASLLSSAITKFADDIEIKTESASEFIKTLEIVGIALSIVPLLFYILVVIPLIIKTHNTALFTFNAISPIAIVSNQFSMNKFKTYYCVNTN